jgi:hypothetical protein
LLRESAALHGAKGANLRSRTCTPQWNSLLWQLQQLRPEERFGGKKTPKKHHFRARFSPFFR